MVRRQYKFTALLLGLALAWTHPSFAADPAFDKIDLLGTGNTVYRAAAVEPGGGTTQFLAVGRSWTGLHYQTVFGGHFRANGGPDSGFASNINVTGKALKKYQTSTFDNMCSAVVANSTHYFVACRSMKSNGYYDVYVTKYTTAGALATGFGNLDTDGDASNDTIDTGIGGDSTDGHAFIRGMVYNSTTSEIVLVGGVGLYNPGYFKPFITSYLASNGTLTNSLVKATDLDDPDGNSPGNGDGGTAVAIAWNSTSNVYYVAMTETGGGSGYTTNRIHVNRYTSTLTKSWHVQVNLTGATSNGESIPTSIAWTSTNRIIVGGSNRADNTAPWDCLMVSLGDSAGALEDPGFGAVSSGIGATANKGASIFNHDTGTHNKDCIINGVMESPADTSLLAVGSAYNGSNYDTLAIKTNATGTLDTAFDGDSGTGDGLSVHAVGSSDDVLNALASFGDTNYVYAVGRAVSGGRTGGLTMKLKISTGSFLAHPQITAISPSRGKAASTTPVTITGTGLHTSGVTVAIGGSACTSPSSSSCTSPTVSCTVTCTAPTGTGVKDVVVTNANSYFPSSVTGTLVNGFTYLTAVGYTSITPTNGTTLGGTMVEIAGSNFAEGIAVTIGGASCTGVSVLSSSLLRCTTPAGTAGAQNVILTNPDTTTATGSGAFTYAAGVTVTNVSPAIGPSSGGTPITITGTNFTNSGGNPTVDIGGVTCGSLAYVSATEVRCTTAASTTGLKSVRVSNNSSNGSRGSKSDGFTYVPTATLTSITPNGGPLAGGTAVTIRGLNFAADSVPKFPTNPCTSIVVVNHTKITCITPSGSGAVSAKVTSGGVDSNTATYTYQAAPSVSTFVPTSLTTAGGALTINGTGFVSGASASVGGVACPGTVFSATEFRCTAGARSAGSSLTATVTNPDAQFGTGGSFQYTQGTVTVSAISPNTGPSGGGTLTTITGTNFSSTCTAAIGGTDCTAYAFVSPTQFTCTTPAKTSALYNVTVNCGNTGTLTNGFTAVTAPGTPNVVSISPNGGPLTGGTVVTIKGSNFGTSATVQIGTVTCTSPVSTDNQVTCTTGVRAASTVNVVVSNGTNSGTLTSAYSYQAAPRVHSVSPIYGPATGGTGVTITGTGFVSGATVTFGGLPCTGVGFVSSTSLTCTTPAQNSSGTVSVQVTNPDTQLGSRSAYTYTAVGEWLGTFTVGAPAARAYHSVIWTGSRMMVWGGWNGGALSSSGSYLSTGAMYNPTTDSWTEMATVNAPSGRLYHTAVWTGTYMIIWGGAVPTSASAPEPPYIGTNTGAMFDPLANGWLETSIGPTVPTARWGHSAIWSGTYMTVWGGTTGSSILATGGRYNPTSDNWLTTTATNAPTGLTGHAAVWTGSTMVVWGGTSGASAYSNAGGRYDPSADTWNATAINPTGMPAGRNGHRAVWDDTNDRMIVWGGVGTGGAFLADGAKYDPSGNAWVTMDTLNAPSARTDFAMFWNATLSKVVVWGGLQALTAEPYTSTGATYDAESSALDGTWAQLSTADAPSPRAGHSVIVGAGYVVVWGGVGTSGTTNTGGRFRPQ